jgi:uncharacterized protein (TIGR03382 family)
MRRLAVSSVVAALLAVLGCPRPADACTPLPAGVHQRDPLPLVGASEVPINARVTVRYLSKQVALPATLALRDEAGADVAVDVTTIDEGDVTIVVLTPRQALAVDSRYSLVDRLRLESECPATGDAPCTGDPVEITYFTTGLDADTTPPISVGAMIATDYTPLGDNTCLSTAQVSHSATVVGVVDAQPPVTIRYNLYDSQGRRFADLASDIWVSHSCPAETGAIDTFTIRAVDIAGNEEVGGHTVTGSTCDDFVRDDGGGCSAGGGAGMLAALGGLGLLARRRRR